MSKGISDEEIIDALREHEPATTTEIGDAVGIARQSASYRLEKLGDRGLVHSKKAGPARIWMLVEDSREES